MSRQILLLGALGTICLGLIVVTVVYFMMSSNRAEHRNVAIDVSPVGKNVVFIADRDKPGDYDVMLMDRQSGECRLLGATQIRDREKIT
jgi:Tol biopolymer transport system component